MRVKILEVKSGALTNAEIRIGKDREMPSIHQNWIFNFDKHVKKPNSTGFVLVAEGTPNIIEGCLIFEMKNKQIPYMAYVEASPHNKGEERKYDYVAGCLIAFAFKQSLIKGQGDYKGMLFFDVQERNPVDQKRLMALYSSKYYAKGLDETTMSIMDEDGQKLINEYLER